MICRQEDDALFSTSYTVKSVEQSREGDGVASKSVCARRLAIHECDIFQQHYCPSRDLGQQMIQSVVCEAALADVQNGNIEVEMTCNSLNEGALSSTRGPVEQIASPIRYATVQVPLA